ncbi:hypothetical protein D3H55_19090 [Bacillus salacetis]|uniref:Uncharacterized protein n=1 Tax=Bacillus salacetis TaxID=2315464 RepID=A0A3A1QSU1_9BACI|nr:hypothetical protein [Bacillus salacetis]RIW29369.1 hypothetical protein D3H55_19090 [Bacillus salacetis]
MRKYLLTWLLVIMAGSSSLMISSQQSGQFAADSMDGHSLTAVDTISDIEAVTVSAITIIEKVPVKYLFPLDGFPLKPKGILMPVKSVSHVKISADTSGFMSAVHHQSNYLSLYL